jgi:Protein of unknown function (DUF2924)
MMDQQTSHQASASPSTNEIERRVLDEIRHLETMTIKELKHQWRELLGSEVPPFAKRGLLTQALAWELQAKTFGGLTPAQHRKVVALGSGNSLSARQIETARSRALRPGVKLLRVWKGVTHHVMVTEDGYEWQNRPCKSLSAIAREITGTPWSGPVFFGLKKSKTKLVVVAEELIDG